jgi:hypothetical protein
MAKCPNCGANLTCGCQKRVVNGVSGCSKCLTNAPAKTTTKVQPAQGLNSFSKNRYNTLNKFTK